MDYPLSRQKDERSSVNQHRSLSGLVSQEQDTTVSGHQIPPSKIGRKKTPAQKRRARKRYQKWLEKKKAGTGYVHVKETVTPEQTVDPKVLDTVSCGTIDKVQYPVETAVPPQERCEIQQDHVPQQPLHESPLDPLSDTDTSVTSSDSELDFDRDCMNDQEFCANCMRQPPECTLKRCTRCLSFCHIIIVSNVRGQTGKTISLLVLWSHLSIRQLFGCFN